MGNHVTNPEQQVIYLKERLNMFLEVLDSIEPESTKVEDIDRLIEMMDDLEQKMDQFKKTKE
ncbi:SE1561 family protein [Chryseomicrobium palamuruense]|uniref:SE1561 family protein n=1 Tax=Chryseomicrobium palamuruense TaxID=682973 RepID=A0ABV8UY97_9BACL